MNDTNIEILGQENVVNQSSAIMLPVNFISVGAVERDSVKIYIKQDVYKRIEKFAKEDVSKEVGSILIGEYVDESNIKSVVISNYIEAKYTDASASSLTFTHETWDYVHKEKGKNYSDKTIVGWQHTHPGYGIFLSNYDIFIQENFFNLPWQIAYVVDPIADTRGFFEWKNGKISKLSGFYIYDDIDREIKISEKPKSVKINISGANIVLFFLLFISVILSISFKIEKDNIVKRLNEVTVITDIQDNYTTAAAEQELPEDMELFRVYIVQSGDCLESICYKYALDYVTNIQKIMKINGITDANKIYADQKLYLPADK